MEFGNIGNYYVAEPLFRRLRERFPDAEIRTTFQMSDSFVHRFQLTTLPLDLYYGWGEDNESIALAEYGAALIEQSTGVKGWSSEFMDEARNADLVIDYSGDIWGDNAASLGKDRFLVGALKDRVAQLLGTPTALIAASPGPFDQATNLQIARQVYPNFDLVTHREPRSTQLMRSYGLRARREESLACPAYLFEGDEVDTKRVETLRQEFPDRPVVGVAISGWNLAPGPFDRWPREPSEYAAIVRSVEHLVDNLGATVLLLSHSNGFPPPPADFQLTTGRDYMIMKDIYDLVVASPFGSFVRLIEEPLRPASMKSVLSALDMLVTGRVHAAVASLSSSVPTVILDYAIPPTAHKVQGFAELTHSDGYVSKPGRAEDIIRAIDDCWSYRYEISQQLAERVVQVKTLAERNFEELNLLLSKGRRL